MLNPGEGDECGCRHTNAGENVACSAEVIAVRLELYCEKPRRMCAGLRGLGERRS